MEKWSLSGTSEFLGIQKGLLLLQANIILYNCINDTLKFCHQSFGTDKTTFYYAKYIHTYTFEIKTWKLSSTRESLQISTISLQIPVYFVSYIYENHTLSSDVTSLFGANKYLI